MTWTKTWTNFLGCTGWTWTMNFIALRLQIHGYRYKVALIGCHLLYCKGFRFICNCWLRHTNHWLSAPQAWSHLWHTNLYYPRKYGTDGVEIIFSAPGELGKGGVLSGPDGEQRAKRRTVPDCRQGDQGEGELPLLFYIGGIRKPLPILLYPVLSIKRLNNESRHAWLKRCPWWMLRQKFW